MFKFTLVFISISISYNIRFSQKYSHFNKEISFCFLKFFEIIFKIEFFEKIFKIEFFEKIFKIEFFEKIFKIEFFEIIFKIEF